MTLKAVGLAFLIGTTGALGADWGGKEVLDSSHYALNSFAKKKGEKVFATLSSLNTKLNTEKTEALVKVSFVEDDTKKTAELNVTADNIKEIEAYKPPRPKDEDWGGKEVQTATEVAMNTFLEKKGKSAYLSISEISNVVSSQKNSVKVKIAYSDEGKEKSQGYFCHLHDVEIDCH